MNDNSTNLTDEQALDLLQQLLANNLTLGMGYLADPETGVLTHQVLMAKVGEQEMQSAPQKMDVPLMPVVPPKETIN